MADAYAGGFYRDEDGALIVVGKDDESIDVTAATYKDLYYGGQNNLNGGTAAQTFIFWQAGVVGLAGVNSSFAAFYLDPADYLAGSRTTELRVRGWVITNTAVAPAINFVFHLYPIATFGGGSATVPTIATVGASAGSATINAPAAGSQTQAVSTPFAFPTAGWYCLACVTSGASAANSHLLMGTRLQVRQA